MKNNKGIKIIVVIASIILLCGTVTGTTILITSCSKGKTVNNTENSTASSVCDNTTTLTDTTKDNVKETTNKETDSSNETDNETTMEETETDATEVNTTTEEVKTQSPTKSPQHPTEPPTKAPQPTTVAPTQAPTKAPQPTTVAPTQAPTKAPQPTTVAPTQAPQPTTVVPTEPPTQEPTTAPVIHGENGRILDTIYFHYTEESSLGTVWKVPETREEFIEVVKGGDINDSTFAVGGGVDIVYTSKKNFFGIGFVLGETILDRIRAFYGEPYAIEYNSSNTVLFYEYKVEGLIMYFVFQNADSSWYSVHICLEEDAGIEESEKL